MMFGSVLEHITNLQHVKRCKTCVSAWMHYFGVLKLRKQFRTKIIHSTALDPKWCLGVLWTISEPSECKKVQNLCFEPECTMSGCQSCENGFAPNASILLHWNQNKVRECFGAFRKLSACEKMLNLCFEHGCTIPGYRSCENSFTSKASILLHWTRNGVWECFGPFWKPSERK